MKRLTQQLQFLKEIEKMKMIYRKNTILDKTRMENDAEHSWTIALMAVVLCEYASSDIDITRVIKMLLLHDLVEIYAGDTYFLDNDHNSKQQEKDAAEKLYHLLPEDQYDEFLEIWTEFEEMKTQNSIYANAIDRLQPFLLDSYTDGNSWKYGNINEKQLLDRLEPIKQLSPVIWESVLLILKQCKEAGDIN